jgi:non-specific protein-tyrosine kinase
MNDFVEVRQVIVTALRWWWLLILVTVVAAGAGYFVSQTQTPVYEATTTIMVSQFIQATELTKEDILASEVLAQTYADMTRRQPVLQGTVDALSLSDLWPELKKRVRVQAVEGTQLLQIRVEASSPEEARAIADEITQQLILLSPTSSQNRDKEENHQLVRQRLERLLAKIEGGQQRLVTLEAAMTEPLLAGQVQELQSEINTLESLIADWENNYTQLLIFVGSIKSPNQLAVIEPAQAGSSPIRPRTQLNTLIAGSLGLLLALALVFLLEFLDESLKSQEDLNQYLGLTTLGSIGRIKGRRYVGKLIISQKPLSHIAETYRMIRTNIQFISAGQSIKSILITSSTVGEGKSTTATNLGVVMAKAGLRTIIVDADLRQPVLHKIFQVSNKKGLTELLRSSKPEIKDYVINSDVKNLQIITSGMLPSDPSELLGSPKMKQVLVSINELADIVIYDSAPVLSVTDATVLASRVDAVVLVIKAGKIKRSIAKQAMLMLQYVDANLLGGVLNQVAQKGRHPYYAGQSKATERLPRPKVQNWRKLLPQRSEPTGKPRPLPKLSQPPKAR